MKITTHIFSSLILAIALYPFFHWQAIFILAGGVLIDADHYIWYALKYKKLSITGCYRHYMSSVESMDFSRHFGIMLIFHTIEFLILVLIFSYFLKPVQAFAIGLVLHYTLDLIFLYSVPKRLIAEYSIIRWVINGFSKDINTQIQI